MKNIKVEGKVRRITGAVIRHIIKKEVENLGKAVIIFGPGNMDNHCNSPEVAMLIYLSKVPVFTIIIILR